MGSWPSTFVGPCMPSAFAKGADEDGAGLLTLPNEVQGDLSLRFLGQQPVARLACASRALCSRLSDLEGNLLMSSVNAVRLATATRGLQRVGFRCLTALRVDLLEESTKLPRKDIEGLLIRLGECLSMGVALRSLSIRLASFDASLERVRLGRQAWEALIRGLDALARYQQLQSLELSFVTIKLSQVMQEVPPTQEAGKNPGREPLTFLKALQGLSSLEDIALTHADIFGSTVMELGGVLCKLPQLKTVDLTRNRISKQVMGELGAVMPPQVQIRGSNLQTICCEELSAGARFATF